MIDIRYVKRCEICELMRRAWKSLQNGFEMDMETPPQGRMHSHGRGAQCL